MRLPLLTVGPAITTLITIVILVNAAGRAVGRMGETGGDAPARGQSLAIIVNRSNALENLSYNELRQVFLADHTHWSDGRRITIVMREPGQPEREVMLRLVYRMSEEELTRHFLHAAFRGEVQAGPKILASPLGVRRFIFNVPGAIGFVRASDLDTSVKALRIDGRDVTDPNYPLQTR